MQTTFDVLVDAHRREIIEQLRRQPRSAGELAAHLGLSQPGTSKHLRRLREAGFVSVRPRAQQRIYSLSPAPFDELDGWLQGCRSAWSGLDSRGEVSAVADAAAPDPRVSRAAPATAVAAPTKSSQPKKASRAKNHKAEKRAGKAQPKSAKSRKAKT